MGIPWLSKNELREHREHRRALVFTVLCAVLFIYLFILRTALKMADSVIGAVTTDPWG